MATNQTANYDLNQWLSTDQVLRTDFNADNAKLDAALADLAKEVSSKADQTDVTALAGQMEQKADSASVNTLDGRALRWVVGSYTGTGTYGSANPKSLDFADSLGRAPAFLLVRRESDYSTTKSPCLAAIRGVKSCSVYPSLINTGGATCSMIWSGTTVTWYGSAAEQQMNVSGDKYFYLVIG